MLATHRIKSIQAVVYFLFGIVTDRTSIKKDRISLINGLRGFVACHLHHRGYHLGIGHIHLTAVGLNIQFLHLSLKKAPPQQHATVPFYLMGSFKLISPREQPLRQSQEHSSC